MQNIIRSKRITITTIRRKKSKFAEIDNYLRLLVKFLLHSQDKQGKVTSGRLHATY